MGCAVGSGLAHPGGWVRGLRCSLGEWVARLRFGGRIIRGVGGAGLAPALSRPCGGVVAKPRHAG